MNYPTLVVILNKIKGEIRGTHDKVQGEVVLTHGEAEALLPILEKEYATWQSACESTTEE